MLIFMLMFVVDWLEYRVVESDEKIFWYYAKNHQQILVVSLVR